jgi:hypothetical protein
LLGGAGYLNIERHGPGRWNEAMKRREFVTILGSIGAWSLVEA